MKNILLINPYVYDFAAYDFWNKPLGLLFVSSYLKKLGFNVNLIDCMDRISYYQDKKFHTKKNNSGKFLKVQVKIPKVLEFMERKYFRYGIEKNFFIKKLNEQYPKPDAICISCVMSYWYYGVNETIKMIKEVFPETPIIFGGIYSVLWKNHCHNNINADYFMGTTSLSKLKIILEELFELNLPEINIRNLLPDYTGYSKLISAAILTSRGCVYNCSYCSSRLLYPGFYEYEENQIFKHLMSLKKIYNVIDYAFYDDALLINAKKRFIPLMSKILKTGLKFRFHLPNAIHAKLVTSEIVNLMKINNFETIRLGVETVDENWHKKNDDKINNNDFYNCIKFFKESGIDNKYIGAYILVGLPDQKIEEVKYTSDFVKNAGIKPDYAFYAPIPNTKYWNMSVEKVPEIKNEPLLTNCSVYSVITGLFFDRRKKQLFLKI